MAEYQIDGVMDRKSQIRDRETRETLSLPMIEDQSTSDFGSASEEAWEKEGENPGIEAYKYNSTTRQCLQGDRACSSKKVLYNGYNMAGIGVLE